MAAFWVDAAMSCELTSVAELAVASQASILVEHHQAELSKADHGYQDLQRLKPMQLVQRLEPMHSVQRLKPMHSKALDA